MSDRFLPGTETWYASDSPTSSFSAVFEDDGETGYFYAYDRAAADPVVDAVHIYNVANVIDRSVESIVEIIWSTDGFKTALLLNDHPHAVIDFRERCSYCRSKFSRCCQWVAKERMAGQIDGTVPYVQRQLHFPSGNVIVVDHHNPSA